MNQLHNNLLLPDCLLYDLPPSLPVFPPSRVCVATVVERANYSCGTGRQWQRSGSPGEDIFQSTSIF